MSSDDTPVDTGIVFLGHQGKQNMPILKTYINSLLAQLGNRSGPPSPFIVKGFKSTVSLKFEQNSFLPDCYI